LTLWAWGIVTSNNPSREGSVMNGMSTFGNVKTEDGEAVNFSSYAVDDEITAWHHAQYYLKAMAAVTDRNALATLAVRTETRGLVITIRNLLLHERWELRMSIRDNSNDSKRGSKSVHQDTEQPASRCQSYRR
jgi:phage-related protein